MMSAQCRHDMRPSAYC